MMEIGQSCWRIWSGVSGYRKWLTTPVAWSLEDGPRVFASKVGSLTPQRQFVHTSLALKNSSGRYHQCSPEPRMWLLAMLLPSPYPAGFISRWNTDPGSSRRRKVLNIFGARLQVKHFCRLHLMVSSALTANFTDNFTFPLSNWWCSDAKMWNSRSVGLPTRSFCARSSVGDRFPHFGSIQAICWRKVEAVLHLVTISLGRLTLALHSETNRDCGFQGNETASLLFERILLSARGKTWRCTCHLRVSSRLSLKSPPKLARICGVHLTATYLPQCPSYFGSWVCGFSYTEIRWWEGML